MVLRVIHCGFLVDDDNDITNIDNNNNNNASNNSQIKLNTQQEGNFSNTVHFLRHSSSSLSSHSSKSIHYLYEERNNFYSSQFMLFLAVASVMFLIFIISMGCEQIDAIKTGANKIASGTLSAQ